ncbi:unnamed protein product [Lactuca saligna]|uniref:Uncharacterized protein n=1 Tax=Lactuca saligna TaxID=75948 RepID=A0AA35YH90_LACSI|nr:unnamed protein product [Lactuca saligna]
MLLPLFSSPARSDVAFNLPRRRLSLERRRHHHRKSTRLPPTIQKGLKNHNDKEIMPNEVGKGQKKAPQEQEEDIISLANLFSFSLSFIFFFPSLSPQFSLSNLRVCAHQARPRSDNFSPNTSHLRLGSRQVTYIEIKTLGRCTN